MQDTEEPTTIEQEIEPSTRIKEEAKPDKAEAEHDLRAQFEQLQRENVELRGTTQRALEEGATARGQVSLILDQIQRAASQGDISAQKAVKTLRDRFDEDPVSAMNDLVTMRVGPIVQEYFGRTADTEREAARQKHGTQFEKYADEVDEFMKDMPLDVKAKAGSYTAALKYVRSQHLEEEIEEARKEERERASRPEGASAAEPRERKTPISREERDVMKAFDMSEDDWHKWGTPAGDRPRKAKK
jgi:predicted NAD-dependent protein-ADP-ribosyltransferase YbiA (DUF1768 family)